MHLSTFTKSDGGKLIAHDERAIGERDHIDRDGPVYDLAPAHEGGPQAKYQELIADLDLTPKSRPLASFMLTLPEAVPEERGREFFQAAYDFLANEIGEENVVSCFVHLDEPGARPHMAFKFVPRVDTPVMTNDKTRPQVWTAKDEKKNPRHKAGEQKRDSKGTLKWERVPKLDDAGKPIIRHTAVASKMFSKSRLTALHPKMEAALCKALGMEKVGIVLDDDDEKKRFSRMDHETFVKVTAAEEKAKAGLEEVQQQKQEAEEKGEELESRAEQGKEAAAAARNRTRELEDAVERERGRALGLEREVERGRGRVERLETSLRRVIAAVRRVPAALEMAAQALPEGFLEAMKSFEDGMRAVEPVVEVEEHENIGLDELMSNYEEREEFGDGGYRGFIRDEDLDL